MPQDSLRSAVYRSFVRCDDPKGVVECGTIRKSKRNTKCSEEKVETRRISKNLNSSSAYKEEGKEMHSKNVTRDLHNPSSFQIVEVSKGAHKLNQVIDSWSNGLTFDGQSEEIARDLLKGALDLQESLAMLGKLQEASQDRAKSKKKQKEKSMGDRTDEVGIQRSNSYHFTDQKYQTGFQKSRLSVDGISRDCFELKEKLIERANYHRFTDCNSQMWLEKPRLSVEGSSRDCFEELRAAIRDSLAKQNLLPPGRRSYIDKRSTDLAPEIASTSSSHSSMVNSHDFATSESSLSSKAPQKSKGSNLIAKLMGLEEIPSQAVQTAPVNQFEKERVSSQRRAMFDIDMPKARKPQSAAYKADADERRFKEIVEAMQFKGLLKSNFAEGFGFQSHHSNVSNSKKRLTEGKDAPPIVIMRPLCFLSAEAKGPCPQDFIWDHIEGALKSNEMHRREKSEDNPIKRLSRRGDKDLRAKPEEMAVKTNDKLFSNKLKASVTVNQQHGSQEIEKKVDRVQKVTPRRKKLEAVENVKSKAKVTSAKERKPEVGSMITKSRVSQRKSASSSVISKHATLTISHTDRKKNLNNEKPVKEPLAANLVVEDVGCEYDDKLIDLSCQNESDLTRISTATADQTSAKEGAEAHEIQIKEQCDSSQDFRCNVMPFTTQHESCIKSAEETKHVITQNTIEEKCFREETEDLFLSSPSFLGYAEDLFEIDARADLAFWTSLNNLEITDDTRLLLDCANELMQHKSLRSQTKHPFLLTPSRGSKPCISLAQLAEEVCDGIENLRSYSSNASEKLPKDNLFAVLERDLIRQGAVHGGWDLGWKHAFTVDEVGQVVGDIEKLVFSGLIEDLLTNFML